MQRAVIVLGLGFGDEGKGATVDFLAHELSAEVVVRYCGGSQAGHNVELPDGRRHAFSQFGAGTLAGAATYLGEAMIVNPPAILNEARHLRKLTGHDPFLKLAVHPRALVTTVYHQALNRLRELSRGDARHGSCGHGIGETRHYWLRHGRDAVFAADLKHRGTLAGKLELLRQRVLLEIQEFSGNFSAEAADHLAVLMEPAGRIAKELVRIGRRLAIQPAVPACTTAIFEGAQGVLLDEWRGFHPFTTWSTVTQHFALEIAQQSGAAEICALGVTRGYLTRHGAGPFPTWDPALDARLVDRGNPPNAWQGGMRKGWLDLVLLRYAAEVAGGPLDGLALNALDDLDLVSPQVCTGYARRDLPPIERLPISSVPCLAAQERLAKMLETVTSIYEPASPAAIQGRLAREIAPIAVTGNGPTWRDRTLRGLRFRPGRCPCGTRLARLPVGILDSLQRE